MDPFPFICVIGLALLTVEISLRMAVEKYRDKAGAKLESILTEEVSRLELELSKATDAAKAREQQYTWMQATADEGAVMVSELDVGRLIQAERDERRARQDLERLRAHQRDLDRRLENEIETAFVAAKWTMILQVISAIIGVFIGAYAMSIIRKF